MCTQGRRPNPLRGHPSPHEACIVLHPPFEVTAKPSGASSALRPPPEGTAKPPGTCFALSPRPEGAAKPLGASAEFCLPPQTRDEPLGPPGPPGTCLQHHGLRAFDSREGGGVRPCSSTPSPPPLQTALDSGFPEFNLPDFLALHPDSGVAQGPARSWPAAAHIVAAASPPARPPPCPPPPPGARERRQPGASTGATTAWPLFRPSDQPSIRAGTGGSRDPSLYQPASYSSDGAQKLGVCFFSASVGRPVRRRGPTLLFCLPPAGGTVCRRGGCSVIRGGGGWGLTHPPFP